MKYILIIIVLFLFSSCNKQEKSSGTKNTDTSYIQNQKQLPVDKESQDAQIKDAQDKSEKSVTDLKGVSYDIKEIPNNIKYTGKITASAKWNDKNGENILIITETDEKRNKTGTSDESVSKELYGYQFADDGKGGYKQVWKTNDFVKDCPVDLTLNYLDKSLSVTDLDNDGIAESIFIYRLACRGDVSPSDMKLLMHEWDTKYAIRGTMYVKLPNEGPYGGDMKTDPSFNSAPKEFLEHAIKQWEKFKIEKFE